MEVTDREGKTFGLTHARWQKFVRLLKQYEGWASTLRAEYGHDLVSFLEESSLLDNDVTSAEAAAELISTDGDDGEPFETTLVQAGADTLVVRAVERKSGLARTHLIPRTMFETNAYRQFIRVHRQLVDLAGTPPF